MLMCGLGVAQLPLGASPPEATLGAPLGAEVPREPRPGKKRWIASWLLLAAANVLDVHASGGHREANPLFRDRYGRFDTRKALVIKGALAGGFFSFQIWRLRANPERNYYPAFTLANSVAATAIGGVALHNYRLPEAPRRSNPAAAPLPGESGP
jgi:hypothetical protein